MANNNNNKLCPNCKTSCTSEEYVIYELPLQLPNRPLFTNTYIQCLHCNITKLNKEWENE